MTLFFFFLIQPVLSIKYYKLINIFIYEMKNEGYEFRICLTVLYIIVEMYFILKIIIKIFD